MKTEYGGVIRAVTCDSDGAHRKARKELSKTHPELVVLPCSAHQVNLIFQDVFKFLPKFKATCSCALSVIGWFTASSLSLGKLFELQMGLYGKTFTLSKPTPTRWYSYYFSFQQLQHTSMALQVLQELCRKLIGKNAAAALAACAFHKTISRLCDIPVCRTNCFSFFRITQ